MRIFVSSSFEDLADYRAAAIRVLRQLGHEVVAMENMVAGASAPLNKVLEMVDRCEAYLGIFAWRYGYVPLAPGPTTRATGAAAFVPKVPDAVPGQTSITHYEYLRARQRALPILAFLLDERAPWPPASIDGHSPRGLQSDATRIRSLRAELQQERVISWFNSPSDLEARVASAVTMMGLSRQIDLQDAIGVGGGSGAQSVMDSAGYSVAQAIGQAQEGQCVFKIDLAEEWWSTRLYLLAALAERLTQVRRLMVVRSEPKASVLAKRLSFVGLIPTSTIIATLRSLHPQLVEFERWLLSQASLPDGRHEAAIEVMHKGWGPAFAGAAATANDAQEAERRAKHHVGAEHLRRWFGDAMLQQPIQIADINRATVVDLIRIVDYPSSCVPVLTQTRLPGSDEVKLNFEVIDKAALNMRLAQSYLVELKERARIA